ncbi:MAG TPA: hypothetical protein ENK81_01655 [Euryarchaeota archaeon]|nr:MAG: hypothetical protein DRN26_02010 [Thermoplasmata archaeon]HHC19096.1 hypothetical protein [Euryarchaeota archaeon]
MLEDIRRRIELGHASVVSRLKDLLNFSSENGFVPEKIYLSTDLYQELINTLVKEKILQKPPSKGTRITVAVTPKLTICVERQNDLPESTIHLSK